MSAVANDLISLLDSSIAVPDEDCLTGTLIDLNDETKPFQSALMTIAEVDDTFGLFTSKPRSNSAPESGSVTTPESIPSLSKSVTNAAFERKRCKVFADENSLSKETSNVENGLTCSNITATSGSRASGINDGFVNSTMGDFEGDISRNESYRPLVASTPTISKPNDGVFDSPPKFPSSDVKANNDSNEGNADSSVESDLLDIENLSTFSISDSSDTSGTEMKKQKFDFLSPRKVRSPSGIAKGKKEPSQLFHKNISITRRVLSSSNAEVASDKISSITSASTPLVMALRKKMSEKAAMQKLDNRNETKTPLFSGRFFPSSPTEINPENSGTQFASIPESSFQSPEQIKNEFVVPTPVKEYAEARKMTTPKPRHSFSYKSGSGITTPTKETNEMSRNVTAIVTPSRRSIAIAKPSTPSGITRQLSTPNRSQYGSTQSLTNRTPTSGRHSFSSSSSSSGSDVSRRLLTLDQVRPVPMRPLVTMIKPQATACVMPQPKFTAGGLPKTSTILPRSKIQPMKALPQACSESSTTTSFKKAANTSLTSHNQNDVRAKNCVSAPVHRKFVHPISSSSPNPGPRSIAAYSLGTPPRPRKETIRSSGYGQQAMSTPKCQETSVPKISNPSPRLGELNHPRYLPKPPKSVAGHKSEIVSEATTTSKIGRGRETKENSISLLRKPSYGK